MMNIIFLDIDGVLNSEKFASKSGDNWTIDDLHQIDPEAVVRLNRLIETANAKIVVSSTWRILYPSVDLLQDLFTKAGINGSVVGLTPYLDQDRAVEINSWLADNTHVVCNYVILDDDRLEQKRDCEDPVLQQHFVRTSWLDGLQEKHVDAAIKVLSANITNSNTNGLPT